MMNFTIHRSDLEKSKQLYPDNVLNSVVETIIAYLPEKLASEAIEKGFEVIINENVYLMVPKASRHLRKELIEIFRSKIRINLVA